MRETDTGRESQVSRRRLLIFRIGQLGDSLVALPALWALRRHYKEAHITLLCDQQEGGRYVFARDLLDGVGVVDAFESYRVQQTGQGRGPGFWEGAKLWVRLRAKRFDTLGYLAPSDRSANQIERDRRFFGWLGIRQFLGMDGFYPMPEKRPGEPLPAIPHEADLLLSRLHTSGVPVPPPGHGCMDLGLSDREEEKVAQWLVSQGGDGGRPWLAVGPGSKMKVKLWPWERYLEVVARLLEEFDCWPVVFGGPEDEELGQRLIAAWGRGHNAAGALGLRAAAAALRRCRLYLGNDTGTMHLAAVLGVRCVAIFSSRAAPGQWYPYGSGHRVFRTPIDCEGCMLEVCIDQGMKCILRVSTAEVTASARELLCAELSHPPAKR